MYPAADLSVLQPTHSHQRTSQRDVSASMLAVKSILSHPFLDSSARSLRVIAQEVKVVIRRIAWILLVGGLGSARRMRWISRGLILGLGRC